MKFIDPDEPKVRPENIAAYSLLLSEALFEVLAEKRIVSRHEVDERIRKLRIEMRLSGQTAVKLGKLDS